VHALQVLDGIEGISFHYFTGDDIVRHPLVQKIVRAYEERDASAGRQEE
jgi:phosphate starvation-inducible PhoH-like protein